MKDSLPPGRLSKVQHRREFLRISTAGTFAAIGFGIRPGQAAGLPDARARVISPHLAVFEGPLNVGVVLDGDRALLIDCGDASVGDSVKALGASSVARILFTHYHRDQCCGAHAFAGPGCRVGVAGAEADLFARPRAFWNDDALLWRAYERFRPDHLLPIDPVQVDDTFSDGDRLAFGPASIQVVETPGHTDGSVSYLVEVDGKRVVFAGDCISGDGQLWDLFSLQRGFRKGEREIGGYHGFMGDRWRLAESLRRIRDLDPELLVPSHGDVADRPRASIDRLLGRLDTAYGNYVSISALRHYFPELFTEYAGRPGQMPLRSGMAPPGCLSHIGTTWMLHSRTGGVLVMDAGSPEVVPKIKSEVERRGGNVEGLWITHYHFDHTDGVAALRREFDCPCFTDRRLAEVLVEPRRWRLPCLAPDSIRVDRPLEDGATWDWHEYRLTSWYYPGQTLYHAALQVDSGDLRMLFVGDSHTTGGLDDYCAYNRNWLGRDVGFQYCLSLIDRLKPTHLFNCHVDQAFSFAPEEIRFMRDRLDERERIFGDLVPWDHANFGTDPSWVRCSPYLQKVRGGDEVEVEVVVTNHSPRKRAVQCREVLPRALNGAAGPWVAMEIAAKEEGRALLRFRVPYGSNAGRYPVAVDIRLEDRYLPQISEALLQLE